MATIDNFDFVKSEAMGNLLKQQWGQRKDDQLKVSMRFEVHRLVMQVLETVAKARVDGLKSCSSMISDGCRWS